MVGDVKPLVNCHSYLNKDILGTGKSDSWVMMTTLLQLWARLLHCRKPLELTPTCPAAAC